MLWLKSGVALWQLLPFPSHTCTDEESMFASSVSDTDTVASDGPPFVTEMKYFTDLPATAWNPASGESDPEDGTADTVFATPRSASLAMARVAGAPDESPPESAAEAETDPVADRSGVIEKVMSAGV
jgi:hypothetical protein